MGIGRGMWKFRERNKGEIMYLLDGFWFQGFAYCIVHFFSSQRAIFFL